MCSTITNMFSTILITAVIALVLIQILNKFRKTSQAWTIIEKIPGPPLYPIIGNLFEFLQTPDKLFPSQRKIGLEFYPIYKVKIINRVAINILNPEDIELLVTNMKHISKSEIYDFLHMWLGTGLLTSTDAKWKSRRKLLTPTFHFNILQEFLQIFNEETKKLTELLEKDKGKSIDVIPAITFFALRSITETSMGLKLDESLDKESYKDAIYKVGEHLTYRLPRPWIYNNFVYELTPRGKENKKLIGTLHDFTNKVIEERQKQFNSNSYSANKRLAMLDLLLKYKSDGANIDNEGIREEVDTFMFEGHDTTSMAICFTLMLLANHKHVQEELYNEIEEVIENSESPVYAELQELKYMDRVLKECLRLYPSVPFIARITGEEMKTATGYTIPKDSMVNVQIYDMHHNPNVFPDPEKFDPDRFLPENIRTRHPFAYLPFSAGPRNCIGQKFALLEMKAVLCGVLRKFVLEPVTRPEDIEFIVDLVLRSKNSIYVKFVPRNN